MLGSGPILVSGNWKVMLHFKYKMYALWRRDCRYRHCCMCTCSQGVFRKLFESILNLQHWVQKDTYHSNVQILFCKHFFYCCGSGSGSWCFIWPLDPDPGYVFSESRISDPGFWISASTHISKSLATIFGVKILKFFVNWLRFFFIC